MNLEFLNLLQKKDASHVGAVVVDIFQHDPVLQALFRDASPHLDKLAAACGAGIAGLLVWYSGIV